MERTNFPLPRELRDQIYGYLLDSSYTKLPITYKESQTGVREGRIGHKFHTNILAVNKEIHDEAEEYLYKNNVFVIASFDCWNLTSEDDDGAGVTFAGLPWVPLVNMGYPVSSMKHHSVSLRLTEHTKLKDGVSSRMRSGSVSTQTYLLVAEDFNALCLTMRFHLHELTGFAACIGDTAAPQWWGHFYLHGVDYVLTDPFMCMVVQGPTAKMVEAPRIKVSFEDHSFRLVDSGFQHSFLDRLSKISCGSLKLTVGGTARFEDLPYLESLNNVMGPTIVSVQAAEWYYYEMLCEAKKQADELLRNGDFTAAGNMFTAIYGLVCAFKERAPWGEWPLTDPLSRPTLQGLDQLGRDCVLCQESEHFVKTPDHIMGMQNKQLLYGLDNGARWRITKCEKDFGSKITQWQPWKSVMGSE